VESDDRWLQEMHGDQWRSFLDIWYLVSIAGFECLEFLEH